MPNLVHVVVHDPISTRTPIGHIVRESRELSVAVLKGVTVLPVDEDLTPPFAHAGLDGFFIKQWGHGWLANKGAGERCCPMVLRAHPQRTFLHWVACLAPEKGLQATGRIRLVGDSSQAGYMAAGLAHLRAPELIETQPLSSEGTWILKGTSTINVTNEGLLAMSLHAVTRNVRILWSAVSLTSHGTDQ